MATARGVWGESYEVPDQVEQPENVTTETTSEVNDVAEKPTVVEPVVETVVTPSAEIITEPIVTPELTDVVPTPEVKEVIKEVEKIVEKYPEMDEYTKELFDALMDGKEDVLLNYLSEKHKDYKTMSDYDVVREDLKKSNPSWTAEEVNLEIAYKYGDKLAKIDISNIDKDLERDEYNEAVQHNRQVEQNEILLKRDSRDARIRLDQGKKEVKLPKIEKTVEAPVEQVVPQEEIDRRLNEWKSLVDEAVPTLKEFTFKVGDKDSGYEDVVFGITDAQRKEQAEFLTGMNIDSLLNRMGWLEPDGKRNVSKLAGDVLKLEAMQQLIQSAYTQGKTAGGKGILGEIKQVDLKANNAQSVQTLPPDIGMAVWGNLNPK